MTQEDLDATTLDAASSVFDDPGLQMRRFKEARSRGKVAPIDSGLAQSGDFGIEVMLEIQAIATAAWQYAEPWWKQNGGNVEAGLLVEAIFIALRGLASGGKGGKGGGGSSGSAQMGDEERTAVTRKVADHVGAAVSRGQSAAGS